jgi:hypothetical protein
VTKRSAPFGLCPSNLGSPNLCSCELCFPTLAHRDRIDWGHSTEFGPIQVESKLKTDTNTLQSDAAPGAGPRIALVWRHLSCCRYPSRSGYRCRYWSYMSDCYVALLHAGVTHIHASASGDNASSGAPFSPALYRQWRGRFFNL